MTIYLVISDWDPDGVVVSNVQSVWSTKELAEKEIQKLNNSFTWVKSLEDFEYFNGLSIKEFQLDKN